MRLVADTPERLEWCMKKLGVPEYLWKLSAPALYDLLEDYGIRTSLSVVYDWKKQSGS